MKKSEYINMAEREKSYWWHLGRLRIIQSYLSSTNTVVKKLKIMNIGCGTGGTIDMLESFGVTDNVDISDDAIQFMKDRGYRRITKVEGISLPFKNSTYDVVAAFDVLEHIADQVDALKEWKRVLNDKGFIIITVPAYQWLWSNHDVSLHHVRRYTAKRLIEVARQADLEAVRVSYAIVFSLPMIVSFRLIQKILRRKADPGTSYVNVPNWLNIVFTKLLYMEAWLHKYIRFPFGTSVIAVFKKST